MKVILREDVPGVGAAGQTVDVKNGYGRNFLIPQGKAVSATEENVAAFEARRAELEKAAAETLAAAQARAEKLEGLTITIAQKAGDEGKLFGSVGTQDIAEACTAAGVEVAKSEVRMPTGSIRDLGEFDIDVQLHGDVTATIKVAIVAE